MTSPAASARTGTTASKVSVSVPVKRSGRRRAALPETSKDTSKRPLRGS